MTNIFLRILTSSFNWYDISSKLFHPNWNRIWKDMYPYKIIIIEQAIIFVKGIV